MEVTVVTELPVNAKLPSGLSPLIMALLIVVTSWHVCSDPIPSGLHHDSSDGSYWMKRSFGNTQRLTIRVILTCWRSGCFMSFRIFVMSSSDGVTLHSPLITLQPSRTSRFVAVGICLSFSLRRWFVNDDQPVWSIPVTEPVN